MPNYRFIRKETKKIALDFQCAHVLPKARHVAHIVRFLTINVSSLEMPANVVWPP